MATYQISPERSTVWVEARSSLHPIHGQATGLEGELDVEVSGDRLDLTTPPAAWLRLAVARLVSGNPLYDREMQRRVDARRYPTIEGQAREVAAAAGEAARYRVRGDITFHGITRSVAGEVTVTVPGPGTLVVEGEQEFDVRDFDVKPPRIAMLKVHPQVRIRVRIESHRRD